MAPTCLRMKLLVWLLTGFVGWSSAIPPYLYGGSDSGKDVGEGWPPSEEQREQVKTVTVGCHPNSLEITVKADMFEIGAPIYSDELHLGVGQQEHCRAQAAPGDEYIILVGLEDCGTKHWVNEEFLIYTNLLVFSPRVTPDGLVRMDEAVIPIECQYERRYRLSSSSLTPTWIPFMSTQAAVETLSFDMKLVTDDWLYDRSSNVFHLGDLIPVEATVRVGHHLGLRVFVNSCVATLSPDILAQPRHVFIENGCLIDSELPGSRSQFFTRTNDETLHMVIDAFRFHNQDGNQQLYITCHLNAVPSNDPEAPQKACTLINGRWKSADGNDYLCASCKSQYGSGLTGHTGVVGPSLPGKYGPRGFGKPENQWKSGIKTNMLWEQEAQVGPLMVLPAMKSGPLPAEDLPPILNKLIKPRLYGSQWRSGVDYTEHHAPDEGEDQTSEDEDASGEETPVILSEPVDAKEAADPMDVIQLPPVAIMPLNMTSESSDLYDPK